MTKAPITDFSNLSNDQIDSWIDKYVTRGLTAELQCQLLFEERARRQSKVLKIEKSLEHLTTHARSKTFTTYGDLANASGVTWNQARYLMNGSKGHLDRLLEVCYVRGLPLLTALCVNQQGVRTGQLSAVALDGFIKGAQRLGYEITDREEFLRKRQHESFDWGASPPQSSSDTAPNGSDFRFAL
jgi:hypothetical protein